MSPLATHSTGFRHPLIVVANLPYVPTAVWKHSEKQVRLFEPQNAIDGGRDGLTVYRQLLRHIKKTGMLPDVVWSEIDASQGDSFPRLVQRVFPAGARTTLFHDLAGLPRLVRTVFEV